jgi:hypothetical protein
VVVLREVARSSQNGTESCCSLKRLEKVRTTLDPHFAVLNLRQQQRRKSGQIPRYECLRRTDGTAQAAKAVTLKCQGIPLPLEALAVPTSNNLINPFSTPATPKFFVGSTTSGGLQEEQCLIKIDYGTVPLTPRPALTQRSRSLPPAFDLNPSALTTAVDDSEANSS